MDEGQLLKDKWTLSFAALEKQRPPTPAELAQATEGSNYKGSTGVSRLLDGKIENQFVRLVLDVSSS